MINPKQILPENLVKAIDRLVYATERASMLTDHRTAALRINARDQVRAALEAAIAAHLPPVSA